MDTAGMKIALVNSEYPSPTGNDHGGIATYTYTLARLLAAHDHTVHVLTRSPIAPDEFSPSVRFHRYGYSKSANPAIRLLNRIHRTPLAWEKGHARSVDRIVRELHRKEGLDIVDIPEYGGLASRYTAGRLPPCAVTFHTPSALVDSLNNSSPSRLRCSMYRLEQEGVVRAAGFKVPSMALRNRVCNLYRLSEATVPVIRNPFDFSGKHSGYSRQQEKRFDILFSGRLEYRKGAEIILHSIRELLALGPEVTVTLAGETEIGGSCDYRHAIEQLLVPGERERVWFPGPLSAGKLQALYANSSMLLLPSLFENCPYVLIEAMAAGLPVVASDSGGTGEIVTHEKNGLLFPPNDRPRLLSLIRSLYSDRDRAARLGEAAARSVRHQFDPDSVINATVNFYRSVIDGADHCT